MFRDCHAIHPEDPVTTGPILHLFGWDKKFVLPFRQLIHKNFAADQHQFVLYGDVEPNFLAAAADTLVYPKLLTNFWALSKAMYRAEKIILHGLFNNHLLYILAMQPWLLKKCYWVMWGGDLYSHETDRPDWRWKKNELLKGFVIERLGHFVTFISGDYDLARKWYGASGEYHECIMYPSNVYRQCTGQSTSHNKINIQIGNSADPSNNHLEVLERLLPFRARDIAIYAPLSYGDQEYAESVIKIGTELFGEKFNYLTEFMCLDQYREFMANIDIAIFDHKRQQAMGNIVTLLGLGKKVHIRQGVTSRLVFDEINVRVFDSREIDLELLDSVVQKTNQLQIKNHFSHSRLCKQLHDIFEF